MKKYLFFILICSTITISYSQTVEEYLGNGHHKQWRDKDFKGALADYNKAIELDTSNCSYLYKIRGELKFWMEDYKRAIEDYNIAINKDPNCSYEFDFGGGMLVSSNINYWQIFYNRGKAKAKLQDYRGAIADYNETIKLKSNLEEAYYYRGKAKAKLQDYRGAILDFNKTINININFTRVYSDRGNAKFDLKDYQGAILDYTKRILLYPDDSAEEFYNRGMARINLKQKESGCLDLSKAGELGIEEAYDEIKKYCN